MCSIERVARFRQVIEFEICMNLVPTSSDMAERAVAREAGVLNDRTSVLPPTLNWTRVGRVRYAGNDKVKRHADPEGSKRPMRRSFSHRVILRKTIVGGGQA